MIAAAWGTRIGGPPQLLGTMATIEMPIQPGATLENSLKIRATMWEKHKIEAPIFVFGGRLWLRIACQIFNEMDDYRRLAAVDFKALA